MESDPDTCPNCDASDAGGVLTYLGAYNVRCEVCHHEWNLRDQLGLPRDYCACCGRPHGYGCGHTYDQEAASIAHRKTVEHFEGACDCFESGPGYIAPPVPNTLYATHAEWLDYLAS